MSSPSIVPYSSVHERPLRYLRSVAHDVVLSSQPDGKIVVSGNRWFWEEWQIVPVGLAVRGALSTGGDGHIIMLKGHSHYEQYLACSKDNGLKMIRDVSGSAHAPLWKLVRPLLQNESSSQFCLTSVATGQLLSCPAATHEGAVKMVDPPTTHDGGAAVPEAKSADPDTVWAWYPDVCDDGNTEETRDGDIPTRTFWDGLYYNRTNHTSPNTMHVVQHSSVCLSPPFSRVFLRPATRTAMVLTCQPRREEGVQLTDLTGALVPAQEWVIEVPTGFFHESFMAENANARKSLASVPIRIRSNEHYRFFLSRVDSDSDEHCETVVVINEFPSLWWLDQATLIRDRGDEATGRNEFYIRSRSSNSTLHGRYLHLPRSGAPLRLSAGAVDARCGPDSQSKDDKANYVWAIDPVVPQVTGLLSGDGVSLLSTGENDESAASVGTSESNANQDGREFLRNSLARSDVASPGRKDLRGICKATRPAVLSILSMPRRWRLPQSGS